MTAAQRSTADRMLTSKGQTVTLTYVGTSVYDPATGTSTNTAPDPETVSGTFFPLSAFRKAQGNIVEGDQQLLLSALNTAGTAITAPHINGTVTDANGDVWTIIAAEPLSPAGLTIMFDCIVRRAA
jgi:hypothetical protein